MKTIIIRADASIVIGSGHVMRCLTIAHKLKDNGHDVRFWMEPLQGNLIEYIKLQGFSTIQSPVQADLYLIDHYEIDIQWERMIRAYTQSIVVIDDLARQHDCDILLDQNFLPNYENRYDNKVPNHCKKLLGPKYLIMREEFIEARQHLTNRNKNIQNLLVFMGGSDPTNETIKILKALEGFRFEKINVVVGNSNPNKQTIERICNEKGYAYHCQISYMAKLMLQADFAIGAGGSSLWERCYLGLPSSSTIVADNQKVGTCYAADHLLTINLGWHEQVTINTYKALLSNLDISNMSQKGLQLTHNERPNEWLNELLELL